MFFSGMWEPHQCNGTSFANKTAQVNRRVVGGVLLFGHCILAPVLYVLGMPECRAKVENSVINFWKWTRRMITRVHPVGATDTILVLDDLHDEPPNLANCPPNTPLDGFFDPNQALPDLSKIVDILNDLPNPAADEGDDNHPEIRNATPGLPTGPPNSPEDLTDTQQEIPDYFGKALTKILVQKNPDNCIDCQQ